MYLISSMKNKICVSNRPDKLVKILGIYVFLGLLAFPYSLKGQMKNKAVVLESAELIISGKTNINEFSCQLIRSNIDQALTHEANLKDGADLFKGMELHFNVSDFECDKSLMTSDFKHLLKEDEFPYITMIINEVTTSGHTIQNGIREISATITLHIAGHSEKEYIQNAHVEQTDQWVALTGTHSILMTTFKIEPPTKFFGTVRSEDSIEILFKIKLE